MPKIARRETADLEALVQEIRQYRPFAGSVRGWLRQNLDLFESLQAGVWQPRQHVEGAPLRVVRPSRWQMQDIRQALVLAGVQYRSAEGGEGSLTINTLNVELSHLRKDRALAAAVEEIRPGALDRFVPQQTTLIHPTPPAVASEDAPNEAPSLRLSKSQAKRVLGANVRDARSRRGLTQSDLVDRSGIGQSEISAIERGEANSKLSTLVKLSRALDEPLHHLLMPAS